MQPYVPTPRLKDKRLRSLLTEGGAFVRKYKGDEENEP